MNVDPITELVDLLAEHSETAPPGELRSPVIAAARAARTGAFDPPPAISSSEAFAASVDQMREVLLDLSPEEWLAPTATPYGRVRDLIAHLVGIEGVTLGWMRSEASEPSDHVAVTAPMVAELAEAPTSAVLQRWLDAAQEVIDTSGRVDPYRPVLAHDIATDVDNMLVMRTFEVWSHTDDVLVAIGRGRAPLDAARAALMSTRLMAAVGVLLQLATEPNPDLTVRVVLTGPGGGSHDVALSARAPMEPDMRIVADVTDLCRLAGRRLDPGDLEVEIEGDRAVADRVLAAARAFARD